MTHLIIAVNQLIALVDRLHIPIVVHICSFDLLVEFEVFLRENDALDESDVVQFNILLDRVENVAIHIAIDQFEVHVVCEHQFGRVELWWVGRLDLVYERLLSDLTFVKANCPAGSEAIRTADNGLEVMRELRLLHRLVIGAFHRVRLIDIVRI